VAEFEKGGEKRGGEEKKEGSSRTGLVSMNATGTTMSCISGEGGGKKKERDKF